MENNVCRQNQAAASGTDPTTRGAGRPRKWETAQERKRASALHRRERAAALEALFRALVNAGWEDPELARLMNHGEDPEIIAALTAHFRKRHWMRSKPADAEGKEQ